MLNESTPTVLDSPTAADFASLVGTAFVGSTPHGAVALELLGVTHLRAVPDRSEAPLRRAPFSLLFLARIAGPLSQGVFALAHDRFGSLDVFMVPVGRDRDGLLLEAVFN